MIGRGVKHIFIFILLVLFQVLILQEIPIGQLLPLFYLYALLYWPINIPRYQVLLFGFVLGLCVDMLSNTPGMHAFATTFAAYFRPFLLKAFITKEDIENVEPTEKSLGFATYWRYALSVIVIHHIVLFTVESFSFFEPAILLWKIFGSSLLTVILVFLAERFH